MDVRKTEIYKCIVTTKIVHYLNELLIETPVLEGPNLQLRLKQAKLLLKPIDLDDIAINRASMGFCGWPGCSEKSPDKRCIELLYMIWKCSMDEDVVDSFHSLKCFESFMSLRRTLDPSVSQLRSVPDELAQDFIENRMASSNVNLLIKDAKIDDIIPESKPKSGKGLKKRVSFKDDQPEDDEEAVSGDIAPSHPAKVTDVAQSDEPEWKSVPKSIAITMSQTTSNDLFTFDYDAPIKVVDKISSRVPTITGDARVKDKLLTDEADSTDGLEFFTSMNDLLECSFGSSNDEEDG